MNRGDISRGILRHLPAFRGRWRVASVIAVGSADGFAALASRRAMRTLMPNGRPVRVKRGLRFRVHPDWIFLGPFYLGDYEPSLSRVLGRYVRPGETVIDVGANFGWYSVLLAKMVGPRGAVHAFEPVPELALLTEDAVALNVQGATVRCNREALGEWRGELTVFTFPDLSHGHASTTDFGRADATPHRCEVTTLDDYAARLDLDDVSLLKIDVEGHELAVLKGADSFLRKANAPVVAFEVNSECLAERGIRPRELEGLLRDYGFTEFWRLNELGSPRPLVGGMPGESADYIAAKPHRAERVARAVRRPGLLPRRSLAGTRT